MSIGAFDHAIEVVLKHEGGLVDHPDDPGGITNYGISLRWAINQMVACGDTALKALDVDGDGVVDADDIRLMTPARARMAYLRFFWRPNRYERIGNPDVATKVFDMCVNMGARQAHRISQRAVWSATGVRIADDGVLGPISVDSINGAKVGALMPALRSEQAGFYRALVIRNDALRKRGIDVEDFSKFEAGWLRRAYD